MEDSIEDDPHYTLGYEIGCLIKNRLGPEALKHFIKEMEQLSYWELMHHLEITRRWLKEDEKATDW